MVLPLDAAFVPVPAGAFQMGIRPDEEQHLVTLGSTLGLTPERISDELPAHEVSVAELEIALSPCTNADFARFVAGGGYSNHGIFRALIADVGAKVKAMMATYTDETDKPGPSTWRDGTFLPGTETHPVSGISFYEADACARFFGCRLPTEAEWELVARYRDGRMFPWGNHIPGRDIANFKGVELGTTSPVGRFALGRSALGLMDLAGNVHEWTSSRYEPFPGGKTRYRFGGDDTARVTRGGDFNGELWDLRTTSRFAVNARLRFPGLGCRFVRSK